mgnify:CR=1 FL=1
MFDNLSISINNIVCSNQLMHINCDIFLTSQERKLMREKVINETNGKNVLIESFIKYSHLKLLDLKVIDN